MKNCDKPKFSALFPYEGNKDYEMKDILKYLLPIIDNYDIIVEPFGGSFSLIRHLILLYPHKTCLKT